MNLKRFQRDCLPPVADVIQIELIQRVVANRGGFRQKFLHCASSNNVCAIRTARRFPFIIIP